MNYAITRSKTLSFFFSFFRKISYKTRNATAYPNLPGYDPKHQTKREVNKSDQNNTLNCQEMQNNRSNIMCATQISQDILQPNQAIIQNRKVEEEKTDTSFFPIQESSAYRKDETKRQAF
jgi:hypothetical protein